MKIVTEEEFLKLPEFTLFRQWEFHKSKDPFIGNHRTVSSIFIKSSNFTNSFYEVELGDFDNTYLASLTVDEWKEYFIESERYEINYGAHRGCSSNNDLFIIYEKNDLIKLKHDIEKAIDLFENLENKNAKTI